MNEDRQREEAAHVVALGTYARSVGISEDAAVATYRRELEDLCAVARVTRFVRIIAERRTRDALRRQINTAQPAAQEVEAVELS